MLGWTDFGSTTDVIYSDKSTSLVDSSEVNGMYVNQFSIFTSIWDDAANTIV